MPSINFTNTVGYRFGRAYVTVELSGPGPRPWVNTDVIVDTGADFLILPDAAAHAVGLQPQNGAVVNVNTLTGRTALRGLQGCKVTVESKYAITATVLFGPAVIPVLGMEALLAAMEVGLQAPHWHYT